MNEHSQSLVDNIYCEDPGESCDSVRQGLISNFAVLNKDTELWGWSLEMKNCF